MQEEQVKVETTTIRKDEKYIKELLKKCFAGVGNWQRAEYCSWSTQFRADYVILGDDYFKYFEIKSEYDSFDDRLNNQFRGYMSTFTHFYLVIPKSSLEKFFAYKLPDGYYGIYLVEDLEQGKIEPFLQPIHKSHIQPRAVADLLWTDDLRDYVDRLGITVQGKKLSTAKMHSMDMKPLFAMFYTEKDSLQILNEVLPKH